MAQEILGVRDTLAPSLDKRETLKGIGGWLLWIAAIQIGAVIIIVLSLLKYYTDPAMHQAFRSLPEAATGEFILTTAYASLILFCAYAFFTKKRYFRGLFVAEVLSRPIYYMLDALWISLSTTLSYSTTLNTHVLNESVANAMGGMLWVVYMYRSVRVRNTFVR